MIVPFDEGRKTEKAVGLGERKKYFCHVKSEVTFR